MSSGEVCVMGQHAAAWHLQQKIGILFGRVTMQHGHAATLGKESRTWAPHHRCSWSHPPPTTNHLRGRINTLLRQLGLDSAALAVSRPDRGSPFPSEAPGWPGAMPGRPGSRLLPLIQIIITSLGSRRTFDSGRVRVRAQAPARVSGVTTRPERHDYNIATPDHPSQSPAVP